GGHLQFYCNSTGIVWKDALEGFRALDTPELAAILAESAARLGGAPALGQDERGEQLDAFGPDFSDLDDQFYQAESQVNIDVRVMDFIRARPSDFFFNGKIRRAVLRRE